MAQRNSRLNRRDLLRMAGLGAGALTTVSCVFHHSSKTAPAPEGASAPAQKGIAAPAQKSASATAQADTVAAVSIPNRAEAKMPDTWNLEALYATPDLWEADFKKLDDLTKPLEAMRGQIKSPKALAAFFEAETALDRMQAKLYSYAMLRSDEDMGNNDNLARKDRISAKSVEIGTRLSWVLPEILDHKESELRAWAKSPLLSKYRRDMQQILRQKPHTLSEKEEKLLSGAGEIFAASSRTFGLLTNADMRFPKVQDSKGLEQDLSQSRYLNFLLDHDRSVRQRAFEAMYDTYGSYRNTFSSTLGSHVKTHNYLATTRNFPSALEAALHPDQIPVSVYDGMISAAHQALPIFYKYVDLRTRSLKLTKPAMYDMSVSIVPEWDIKVPYEQACQWIVEACKPLGEEYTTALQSAFKDRWVDVYENKGKRSGAYSEGCYDSLPYILMNYQGTLDSLFTLAHELGHSMHTWLANKYQPPRTAGYPIFIAEIPSTLNEGLLLRYLLETQKDPRFRASLLNQYCDTFRGTVYRQTMFAEFEKIIHEKDAQGYPLMPDTLDKVYFDLNREFYGPAVEYDKEQRIGREWSRIPHFYYDFYVYKYATSYCASQIFLKRLAESETQRDQYLNLLKSGSTDDPLVLIQKAGVDLTKPETLRSAFETFDKTVAELDETLKKL